MASKYVDWIHQVSNRRFIVAHRRDDGRWCSKNTLKSPGEHTVIGQNCLDLVAKKVRTYANWNAAVKAYKRIYPDVPNLPENEIVHGPRI